MKYVGGETYLEKVPSNVRYADLMHRMSEKVNGAVTLKYSPPGEEVDVNNLVTCVDDDHVQARDSPSCHFFLPTVKKAAMHVEEAGSRLKLHIPDITGYWASSAIQIMRFLWAEPVLTAWKEDGKNTQEVPEVYPKSASQECCFWAGRGIVTLHNDSVMQGCLSN